LPWQIQSIALLRSHVLPSIPLVYRLPKGGLVALIPRRNRSPKTILCIEAEGQGCFAVFTAAYAAALNGIRKWLSSRRCFKSLGLRPARFPEEYSTWAPNSCSPIKTAGSLQASVVGSSRSLLLPGSPPEPHKSLRTSPMKHQPVIHPRWTRNTQGTHSNLTVSIHFDGNQGDPLTKSLPP